MKKIAIITAFIFTTSLFSCNKNDLAPHETQVQSINDLKVVDGRLVFKNFEVFSKTYENLAKKTIKEHEEWANLHDFISLGEALKNDENNNDYLNKMKNTKIPLLYFSILNAKGEFQIGEDIMWFDKNKRYTGRGEEQLKKIKENPSITKNFIELKSNLVKSVNKNNRMNLSVNSNSVNYHRFDSGAFQYKYVHELYTFSDVYPFTTFTTVNLDIKFEYSKESWHSWYDAGESRNININISGDATYLGPTQYFNLSENLTATGTVTRGLAFWSAQSYYDTDYINIDINGSIYQLANVTGATAFNDTGLW